MSPKSVGENHKMELGCGLCMHGELAPSKSAIFGDKEVQKLLRNFVLSVLKKSCVVADQACTLLPQPVGKEAAPMTLGSTVHLHGCQKNR